MRQFYLPVILCLAVAPLCPCQANDRSEDRPAERTFEEFQAAHQQLETARQGAIGARLKLAELTLERRMRQWVAAQPSAQSPTFVQNPEWKALAAELANLESQARQLAETLQSAHPDMQAIDAKINDLRVRLDSTPQLVRAVNDIEASVTSPTVGDADLDVQIEQAAEELQLAERNLAKAVQAEEQALLALSSASERRTMQALAAVKKNASTGLVTKPDKPSSSIDGWTFVVLGIVIVAVAWRWRPKSVKSRDLSTGRGIRRVDKPVQRIVYPSEIKPRTTNAD